MTAGLLGTGISGLLSSNTALATTSQNIANVNTEGYSRQRVELTARNPQPYGNGFLGNGVYVTSIERMYDQFLTTQLRTSMSGYSDLSKFTELSSQVDNVLADVDAGLMPTLQEFFQAVQDVANDPTSSAARQSMLSSGESLVDRFNYLENRFEDLRLAIQDDIRVSIVEINEISSAISDLNRRISEARAIGRGEPNDLLDRRDRLVTQLSEKVSVTTVDQDDGSINVFIGNGQAVVTGFNSYELTTTRSTYDRSEVDIAFVTPAGNVNVTSQITGGELGGLLDFRGDILDRVQNILGFVAVGVSETFNAQHQFGLDLRGQPGQNFFNDISLSSAEVFRKFNNTGLPLADISVEITDVNSLVVSDYQLINEAGGFQLIRLSDDTVFSLPSFPATPAVIDGMTITLDSGTIDPGDSFIIRPTGAASRELRMNITDQAQIAAAAMIRVDSPVTNNGSGFISGDVVTDLTLFDNDTYTVTMAFDSAALADGGATRGVITDNNNDSTLEYQLRVNDILVYSQPEGAPPLVDNQALADAINGVGDVNIAQTGVRAYVDPVSGDLFLANEPSSIYPISIDESLVTSAGTIEDGDTVTGYFGSVLTGLTAPQNTVSFSGPVDSYVVTDSTANIEISGAYVQGASIQFNGISFEITGDNMSGDQFIVQPNVNGVSDNRNMLELGKLQNALVLNNSSDSYGNVYSRLVSEVGISTYQAELNRDAQEGLLNRAVEARERKSGVNLDEEASNMIRYQQLYQASAQVIMAADKTFNSLVDVLRR